MNEFMSQYTVHYPNVESEVYKTRRKQFYVYYVYLSYLPYLGVVLSFCRPFKSHHQIVQFSTPSKRKFTSHQNSFLPSSFSSLLNFHGKIFNHHLHIEGIYFVRLCFNSFRHEWGEHCITKSKQVVICVSCLCVLVHGYK